MNKESSITVETIINASIQSVWKCWTDTTHLVKWNNAFDDWHTPFAENDVRKGGKLKLRMEAIDGSAGFDHEATYDEVITNEKLAYTTTDDRKSIILFTSMPDGIKVTETFEAEPKTPLNEQRSFVQSILERFKKYVEEHQSEGDLN